MSIIEGIILGIVILIILLWYLLMVFCYIAARKDYKKSIVVTGTIQEGLEIIQRRSSSHSTSVTREYMIQFYAEGKENVEKIELSDTKHRVGDEVEIRYYISEKGKMEVIQEGHYRYVKMMAIGSTIGLLFGIAISIYQLTH